MERADGETARGVPVQARLDLGAGAVAREQLLERCRHGEPGVRPDALGVV